MLILTRRVGDALVVDQDITIRVVAVKGNSVRLGIDAPEHVVILRKELFDREGRDKAAPDAAEGDASSR